MIQQPHDLETAVSLALLQKEIEEDIPKMTSRQGPARQFSRQNFSPQYKQQTVCNTDDKSTNVAAKVSALKAYRKARGQCFTCGEKWAPGHKFSAKVEVHVVEELLAMIHVSEGDSTPSI